MVYIKYFDSGELKIVETQYMQRTRLCVGTWCGIYIQSTETPTHNYFKQITFFKKASQEENVLIDMRVPLHTACMTVTSHL